MDDSLAQRGRSLEEAFFRQRDAELIEHHKKLELMKTNREALMLISGIRNPKVLDQLTELGISPSVLASLAILPLIEVAWADGELSASEKQAVMDGAAKGGLVKGSIDHAILEAWLKERPDPKFLNAWMHYIEGLREVMQPEELKSLKSELLERAKAVAEAAGGFVGLSRISSQEQAVLSKMEKAFGV